MPSTSKPPTKVAVNKRGVRGQAGIADGGDDRHRNDEQDRDGEEAVPLQPPAQHQRADRAADLKRGAGERRRRLRQLGSGEQRRRPADEEEIAHQVEGEQQPDQRRDQPHAVTEQIDRTGDGTCCSSSMTKRALAGTFRPGLMVSISRSMRGRWLSCSAMYLIDSGSAEDGGKRE